ncbi:DNA-directed RNA polymerase subunit N [Candidatus Woesearchaeota archaeon]|nr:DNA-directed RNA polymerase subunit N [Candidatus Woesearchaeota archaeon]
MIIPIRCYSCGKPIAHLWSKFLEMTNNREKDVKESLDKLGLKRYCCRSHFMGHIDLLQEVGKFKKD